MEIYYTSKTRTSFCYACKLVSYNALSSRGTCAALPLLQSQHCIHRILCLQQATRWSTIIQRAKHALLSAPARSWAPGHCWALLRAPGRSCVFLAPWRLLGAPGRSWAFLAAPGRSWTFLGGSGRSWALLGAPRRSWAFLDGSGRYWTLLDALNHAFPEKKECPGSPETASGHLLGRHWERTF